MVNLLPLAAIVAGESRFGVLAGDLDAAFMIKPVVVVVGFTFGVVQIVGEVLRRYFPSWPI